MLLSLSLCLSVLMCGRCMCLMQDPVFTDFLARPPLQLKPGSEGGSPSAVLQVDCGESAWGFKPLACNATSRSHGLYRYCCTSVLQTLPEPSTLHTCLDLTRGYNVWHELLVPLSYVQNAGSTYCIQQVLLATDTWFPNEHHDNNRTRGLRQGPRLLEVRRRSAAALDPSWQACGGPGACLPC